MAGCANPEHHASMRFHVVRRVARFERIFTVREKRRELLLACAEAPQSALSRKKISSVEPEFKNVLRLLEVTEIHPDHRWIDLAIYAELHTLRDVSRDKFSAVAHQIGRA